METIVHIKKFDNCIFFKKETKRIKFNYLKNNIYYTVEQDTTTKELYYLYQNEYYLFGLCHDLNLSNTNLKNLETIQNIVNKNHTYEVVDEYKYFELLNIKQQKLKQKDKIKNELEKQIQQQKDVEYTQSIIEKIKNQWLISGQDLLRVCDHLKIELHIRTIGCIKKILQLNNESYRGMVTRAGGSNACNVYQQIYNQLL